MHRTPRLLSFASNCELTAQEAEARSLVAYDAIIKKVGRNLQKIQKRMSQLLQKLEQQQDHLDEMVPFVPGLLSVIERALGRNSDRWDLELAVHDLMSWNEVLVNTDGLHSAHADLDVDAEMLEPSATSWDGHFALIHCSTPPFARKKPRIPIAQLADELLDGVDVCA